MTTLTVLFILIVLFSLAQLDVRKKFKAMLQGVGHNWYKVIVVQCAKKTGFVILERVSALTHSAELIKESADLCTEHQTIIGRPKQLTAEVNVIQIVAEIKHNAIAQLLRTVGIIVGVT